MSLRNFFSAIPPVTKNLIIINFIVWLAMMVVPARTDVSLETLFGLHYWGASDFNPVQLITYMFMHDTRTMAHLFFNMFTLFMFGITLERALGPGRFLFYYLSCGVGAALVQELTWELTWKSTFVPILANLNGVDFDDIRQLIDHYQATGQELPFLNSLVTVGASGSIYGLLLAFAMIWPDRPIFLMFIPVPVKAKWMVIGFFVIELLIGLSNAAGRPDGVAHFAHMGGMIFGFIMIWFWKKNGTLHKDVY